MRGGKREGAGRRKGSVTKATAIRQELIARAAAEGISPLEVMMTAMREAWAAGDQKLAFERATACAPYMHPRLAATTHSGDTDNPLSIAITSAVPRADADDDDQRHPASSH